VDILLMAIDGYSIGGYWCLSLVSILVVIILVAIGCYFITTISDYSINGYW
jgi:hypothetical protein